MALNLRKLLIKNYTIESDREATSTFACRGYVSRVLTSRHKHVEFLVIGTIKKRADGHGAARVAPKVVCSDFLEGFWV